MKSENLKRAGPSRGPVLCQYDPQLWATPLILQGGRPRHVLEGCHAGILAKFMTSACKDDVRSEAHAGILIPTRLHPNGFQQQGIFHLSPEASPEFVDNFVPSNSLRS